MPQAWHLHGLSSHSFLRSSLRARSGDTHLLEGRLAPYHWHSLGHKKRFSTRKKAEDYMSKSTGPGDPLLAEPSAFILTDGSALPNGSAGWGVHITFPGIAETRAIWDQSLYPLQDATG